MKNRLGVFALLLFVAWPVAVVAQSDRYDAGRKLIAFEQAFDRQSDADARKRIVPLLQRAFSLFMSGRMSEAGRVMDEARWTLTAESPPAHVRWADAIVVRPAARLVDPKNGPLKVLISRLYDPKVEAPTSARIQITLLRPDGSAFCPTTDSAISSLPAEFTIGPLASEAGDFRLRASVIIGEKTFTNQEMTVSLVPDLTTKLERLRSVVEKLPETGLNTDQLTLKSHLKLLTTFAKGTVGETDFPLSRLCGEAEAIAFMPSGGKYYEGNRTGQFWLSLATSRAGSVRLFVPEESKKGDPLPLVVALHGAGASENLFFDAYGHGETVRQCAKRGWLLVATRTEFFAPPPVAEVVDELSKHYPVDKARVFIVGHSMGAAQAMALARQFPDRCAGVAALGGSARISPTDPLKKVPFFIGCGTEDFAMRGAKSLAKSLVEAGCDKVEFRDYPDVEHIAIVQVALPDVFKWYDTLKTK